MKIQPITCYSYSGKKIQPENKYFLSGKCNAEKNNPAEFIFPGFIYNNISFTSSTKRTNGTDKKNLAEKSGDFAICRFPDITCPSCGKKMLTKNQISKITEELSKCSPDEYLEYIGRYREYMRPVEESVYDEILGISAKKGASKDIRTLLVSLRDTKMPVLQQAQMRQVKKMKSLAKTLPDDEKKVLLAKLKSLQQIIKKNNASAPFRRKIMIDRISKIKIKNPKKYQKLQNIAKGFPTSSDMNSAWIVKYSGKNKHNKDWKSYDIALRFLTSSVANTDHIIAYDIDNNHNDISNYMAMHNACNSQKSNKSFLQWLNEDKDNRIKYMRQYFDDVSKILDDKKIKKKKYKDYVDYATKTVFEASKGQVKIFEDKPFYA